MINFSYSVCNFPMIKQLTEHTLIPIGLAIFTFGGAAAWLTTLHVTALANSRTLNVIINKQEKFSEDLSAIRQDIAVIKTQLSITQK